MNVEGGCIFVEFLRGRIELLLQLLFGLFCVFGGVVVVVVGSLMWMEFGLSYGDFQYYGLVVFGLGYFQLRCGGSVFFIFVEGEY